jgi:transcriptional regulator with XRE-family HTH domain
MSNIREIRELKSFSQEGFAHQVDLDRTYIGGVERGERNLAALHLIRIAAALDVEVGELFPAINKLTSD